MDAASNDHDDMLRAADEQASGRNLGSLLTLLRETLAELEREAIGLERLVLRQGEQLRRAGLDSTR